jgi:hypothetical protein
MVNNLTMPPQAPPELRATLRTLDQHIDQQLAHARLPAAA